MLDGIHFNIPKDAVLHSDVLEFRNSNNGQICEYKGLKLHINNNMCFVRGSIHKYYNNGEHNYNNFTLLNFIDALNDLCRTLNINPQTTPISRIEVGVNIDIGINIDEFISFVTLFNNTVPITESKGVIFKLDDYNIKIYKKELKGCTPLLRYELVIKRKRKRDTITKKYAPYCNTLADLTNSSVWEAFAQELASTTNELLIIDTQGIDYNSITPKDRELLINGVKPHYWRKEWKSRATKNRHLKRIEEISEKNRGLKASLYSLIKSKTKELINAETKAIYKEDFFVRINNKNNIYFYSPTKLNKNKSETFSPFRNSIDEAKSETFSPFRKEEKEEQNETFSHVDKVGIRNIPLETQPKQVRRCTVTGLSLDIGIKQNDVLSTKGVEFYYHNKRKVFYSTLYPRLSDKMKLKPLKKQFEEIAHSLRNSRSNPRNNLKRDIKNLEQGNKMLFCYTDMLRKDKQEIYKKEIYNLAN